MNVARLIREGGAILESYDHRKPFSSKEIYDTVMRVVGCPEFRRVALAQPDRGDLQLRELLPAGRFMCFG